jgi:DNA invertase Pin-like site-specific DNA recombinase
MTTIGYVRVSTETQVEGFGLDEQRLVIRDVAIGELRRPLGDVYADEGISGKEGLEHRTGLAQALDHLTAEPGLTLIIPRLDRLARDLMVQEQILAEIWRAGATVITAAPAERIYCQPDDPGDPSRKLIRQVLGAVAEYERAMIRLRMTRGRRRLLDAQGWAGGPEPYGWSDPAEVAVLDYVGARRRQGVPWQTLARLLNHSGKAKRNGRPWTAAELQRTYARNMSRHADPHTLELT